MNCADTHEFAYKYIICFPFLCHCQSCLTVCKDVLRVSVGDGDFRDHLLQHVASVLQTGE